MTKTWDLAKGLYQIGQPTTIKDTSLAADWKGNAHEEKFEEGVEYSLKIYDLIARAVGPERAKAIQDILGNKNPNLDFPKYPEYIPKHNVPENIKTLQEYAKWYHEQNFPIPEFKPSTYYNVEGLQIEVYNLGDAAYYTSIDRVIDFGFSMEDDNVLTSYTVNIYGILRQFVGESVIQQVKDIMESGHDYIYVENKG